MPQTKDHPDIVHVVVDTLTLVVPTITVADADTSLMGSEAVVDSVGFVTLLVSLEQNLAGKVDLVSSFSALGDVAEKDHPFRTVNSLASHIQSLLAL
jgi:acyl carrier protein